jgi:hypothetical protein
MRVAIVSSVPPAPLLRNERVAVGQTPQIDLQGNLNEARPQLKRRDHEQEHDD